MKKLIAIPIVILIILLGYTGYVYYKAHTLSGNVEIVNNAPAQPKEKYIPRIPTPTQFPTAPESPVPADVQPYLGTWVLTNVIGQETYPALGAAKYALGKTVTIEQNLYENNSEFYPEKLVNPQYTMIYPNASDFRISFPYLGSAADLGVYDGIPTIAVNQHGITPNPSPEYNFGTVYLEGGHVIIDANGVFFSCERQK